jgi:FixJ family two-component response regulator
VSRPAASLYGLRVTSAAPLIAVVDDESSVRTMLGRLLRLADYRVSAFASGEDFLASLAVQRPACAVLDIHMPGLTGLDVQQRMRATRSRIPVVFITASDDVALDRSAFEAGAVRLLRKPFSSDELLKAIGMALHHREQGT